MRCMMTKPPIVGTATSALKSVIPEYLLHMELILQIYYVHVTASVWLKPVD